MKDVKEFRIGIGKIGYFGSPGHVKTLWIDVNEGREELVNLIVKMNQNLNHIRHEVRKPNPHLTIGRVKSGRNREILLETINSMKNVKLGEMIVKFVKLKQSILTREGPVYSDVKVFELA